MKQSRFFEQTKLMVRCIPSVAQESCFALKGGTAINLFVRDMPRLSVDIDLTYLPLESRNHEGIAESNDFVELTNSSREP